MKSIWKSIFVIILISINFTGCIKRGIEYESLAEHTNLVEKTEYGKISMEFSLLNGEEIRSFKARPGKNYVFNYEYLITAGSISLQFRDSQNRIIDEVLLSADEYNDTKLNIEEKEDEGDIELYEFGSSIIIESKDKKIKVVISGENAKGKIDIAW